MIECQICMVDYEENETFQLPNCLHRFCKVCLTTQFKTKIENQEIDLSDFKCPGCERLFNPEITQQFLAPELYQKYCNYALEMNKIFGLEDHELMMNCLNPKCDMKYIIWKDAEYMMCPTCNQKFCRKCNLQYHQDKKLTCEQQKALHKDAEYIEMKRTLKICRCPKCKQICEKESGCNFMTCKCKTHFCFLCDVELTQEYHWSHFQKNDPSNSPCKVWYNNTWVEPSEVPKVNVVLKKEEKKIPCINCRSVDEHISQLALDDKIVICKSVKCQNKSYCMTCGKQVQQNALEQHFDLKLLKCIFK